MSSEKRQILTDELKVLRDINKFLKIQIRKNEERIAEIDSVLEEELKESIKGE